MICKHILTYPLCWTVRIDCLKFENFENRECNSVSPKKGVIGSLLYYKFHWVLAWGLWTLASIRHDLIYIGIVTFKCCRLVQPTWVILWLFIILFQELGFYSHDVLIRYTMEKKKDKWVIKHVHFVIWLFDQVLNNKYATWHLWLNSTYIPEFVSSS